jgi:hypothetical protein
VKLAIEDTVSTAAAKGRRKTKDIEKISFGKRYRNRSFEEGFPNIPTWENGGY